MEKQLDFGNIPVGLSRNDLTCVIRNQMRSTAIFHVECNSEELTITPMKGKIGMEGRQTF